MNVFSIFVLQNLLFCHIISNQKACHIITWCVLSKVFIGNRDRNTVVQHVITNRFTTTRVRLHPTAWHSHISLRWELYGWPGMHYTSCNLVFENNFDQPHIYICIILILILLYFQQLKMESF